MSVITPVATTMRRIAEQDNPAIAAVIRTVSAEYGLTADKGYTVADPNLDELFQLYSQPGMPTGSSSRTVRSWAAAAWRPSAAASRISANCRKCISCQRRGQGLAKKLALMALDHARKQGFTRCYLETTAFLKEAIGLYEHLGFEHIDAPLGCTGHVDCEVRMLKSL
jgi:putative acetyltransferase